jgi:hypothetical protein
MKAEIKKFGFEVEGEFSQNLMNKLQDRGYGKIATDGSLKQCPYPVKVKYHSPTNELHNYEFVSRPLLYSDAKKKTATKIFNLLNVYYKKKEFHWNESAGFHVHLSFEPQIPVEVWSKEFAEFFKQKLQERFKLVYKKRKDEHYCEVKIDETVIGDLELRSDSSERYCFINFTPAYKKHGTIEFRIFPANKPLTMKKYLKATFRIVEEFLAQSDTILHREFEFEESESEVIRERIIEASVSDKKEEKTYEGDSLEDARQYGKFIVGDIVRGLRNNHYSITTNGWVGRVVKIDGEVMFVQSSGSRTDYNVLNSREQFELVR